MMSAGDSRRYVVPTRRKFCSVMVERNFLRGGMKFTSWWNDLASAAFPLGIGAVYASGRDGKWSNPLSVSA